MELLQITDISLNGFSRRVVTLYLRACAQSVVKVKHKAQAGLIRPLCAEGLNLHAKIKHKWLSLAH